MIGVAVVGCGIVGSGVVKMLTENHKLICGAAGMPVGLTHVVDIREIPLPHTVQYTGNFDDILSNPEIRIVVETIGGIRPAYTYTKRALESGRHVVTSNKALVAAHGDELVRIARAHGVKYLFEASVGGGVPVIRPITLCLSGNRIDRIDGIVNGSTNYLLTRMDETGVSFPAALQEAQKLGYVEGNPDADIEGWDARRKLAILAGVAFGSKFSDDELIPTEGIGRITEWDLACARALGRRIKLIAHAQYEGETWSGWVSPALVSPRHAFFNILGVYNAIEVHGDYVGDIVFQGQGAGSRPTASAVVGDIIDIAGCMDARRTGARHIMEPVFRSPEQDETRLMMRVEGAELSVAKQLVLAAIPDASFHEVGDMLAVITPKAPYNQLLQAEKHLSALGLRVGVPMRVL